MQVRMLYFASARERAGHALEVLTVREGATVSDLAAQLAARHPALAGLLPACRFAVNQAFADPGARLAPGDEVALIPPVAGG